MNGPMIEYLRNKLRKIWPGLPSSPGELRLSVGDAVTDVARLSLATVLGYLLTVKLLPPPVDLTGALTALLVVQASLRGSFRVGMARVAAVVTGIGTALVVATFVGLHWWSLAMVVFVALMMARVLRLEGASMEAAISAMLILGSSGVDVAAFTRFATTIIGAAVGVALPLLWPRRVRNDDLTRDLAQVALRLREVYDQAADHLSGHPMTQQAAGRWRTATWQISPLAATAASTLDEAAEVKKWNTRQLFQADVVPLLREGLSALARVQLATAHLFRVIEAEAPKQDTPDDGYGDLVRPAMVDLLRKLGRGIQSYADLVIAEAGGDTTAAEASLSAGLTEIRAAQAHLVGLMKVDPNQTSLWLLRGSTLSATEQIITELDLDTYRVNRDEWRASQLGRSLPAGSIGPRIRHPLGLYLQGRLRRRAATSRKTYPEDAHLVSSDETTVLMPVTDPPRW